MKTRCGLKYNISTFDKYGSDFVTFTPDEMNEIEKLTDEEFKVAWILKKDNRLKLNINETKQSTQRQMAFDYASKILCQLKNKR